MLSQKRIIVETQSSFIPVPVSSIILGESDFKKCIIHTTDNNHYHLNQSLKELENQLGAGYIRVSRQWVVKADCIASIEKPSVGRGKVILKDGITPNSIEISADKINFILAALEK